MRPEAASSTTTTPAFATDATSLPSGDQAIDQIGVACRSTRRSSRPPAISQIRSVPSLRAPASRAPSGDRAAVESSICRGASTKSFSGGSSGMGRRACSAPSRTRWSRRKASSLSPSTTDERTWASSSRKRIASTPLNAITSSFAVTPPERRSQRRTRPSYDEADRRHEPSGENTRRSTWPSCPARRRSSSPVDRCHRTIWLSAPPVATRRPSADSATAVTDPACPTWETSRGSSAHARTANSGAVMPRRRTSNDRTAGLFMRLLRVRRIILGGVRAAVNGAFRVGWIGSTLVSVFARRNPDARQDRRSRLPRRFEHAGHHRQRRDGRARCRGGPGHLEQLGLRRHRAGEEARNRVAARQREDAPGPGRRGRGDLRCARRRRRRRHRARRLHEEDRGAHAGALPRTGPEHPPGTSAEARGPGDVRHSPARVGPRVRRHGERRIRPRRGRGLRSRSGAEAAKGPRPPG